MRTVARRIALLLLLFALPSVTVNAYTAEDLYNDFGIEFEDPHSAEDISTITSYRYARKYIRIFSHLSAMSFDNADMFTLKDALQTRLDVIETSLLDGFRLSLDEIYELETEYRETLELLNNITDMTEVKEIPLKQLDIESIPTFSEYAAANARNTLINTQQELGSNLPKLTANAYVISDYTDSSITIGTTELAIITSLFNGEVIYADDNVVTIDHYTDIYTSYRGLTPIVSVGDTVYQGKCIGYSKGNVSARLKIKDIYVDIYEYLEGQQ